MISEPWKRCQLKFHIAKVSITNLFSHSVDGGDSVSGNVDGHCASIDDADVLCAIYNHLGVDDTAELARGHGGRADWVPDADGPLSTETDHRC